MLIWCRIRQVWRTYGVKLAIYRYIRLSIVQFSGFFGIFMYDFNLFQPAGESIVIHNSHDSDENNHHLCNRYNSMRNDSRSILPCVNDKIAMACQQQQLQPSPLPPPPPPPPPLPQQTNADQLKNQTTTNICQRDSGYGSSPDSEPVELQTLA